MKVHDFKESLAESMKSDRDQKTESELYEYFGRPKDWRFSWAPRLSKFKHDANVFAWGGPYRVEEKRRFRSYNDEFLEDISSTKTGRLGWTWRAGEVDFVVFTFPDQRMHVWPGLLLELVWRKKRNFWVESYGHKSATNNGYQTLNIPVPTNAVTAAMMDVGGEKCIVCGRIVGAFRQTCGRCGALSCCHIADSFFLCKNCSK